MHVKYQLIWENNYVKIVNTKKNRLHKFATCNSNFEKLLLQTCIIKYHYKVYKYTPIFKPNLKRIGLIDIVKPLTKDGRTDRHRE